MDLLIRPSYLVSIGKELTRYLDAIEHLKLSVSLLCMSKLSSKVVRGECSLLAESDNKPTAATDLKPKSLKLFYKGGCSDAEAV